MWDHYARLSSLLGPSASQSSSLLPLHSLRVVSIHPEGTLGRLRYSLGGDRPSQTTRLALSDSRFHGSVMRHKLVQEWYFTAASPAPTSAGSSAPTYPTHAPAHLQATL